MTCNGTFDPVHGRGVTAQHFTVGPPCDVRQVGVRLFNEAGAVVDEKVVDVVLRYER